MSPEARAHSPEQLVAQARLESIWQQWGEITGLSRNQFDLIAHDAQNHYGSLPYHNFGHALDVLEQAMKLADICEANDRSVNRRVLTATSLLHDTSGNVTAYDSPYSELLAAGYLRRRAAYYGLTAAEADKAASAIETTGIYGNPQTIEERIVARADLHNIGGDYFTSFVKNTLLLREEAKQIALLKGEAFSEARFLANSIKLLSLYLKKDLSLGAFDADWSAHAATNVNRLIYYAASQEGKRAMDYVIGLNSSAVRHVFNALPLPAKLKRR